MTLQSPDPNLKPLPETAAEMAEEFEKSGRQPAYLTRVVRELVLRAQDKCMRSGDPADQTVHALVQALKRSSARFKAFLRIAKLDSDDPESFWRLLWRCSPRTWKAIRSELPRRVKLAEERWIKAKAKEERRTL